MKLKDFKQKLKFRFFEVDLSKLSGLHSLEGQKTSGFCLCDNFGEVALYPGEQYLIVKINDKQWSLGDPSVLVTYFHNYENKTTTFKIENNEHVFNLNYYSWWANRDDFIVNPYAASCEEENSKEDMWAYIDNLFEFPDKAKNLHAFWSKNR